jgi:murein L,D-transpeptidase YcbB/YkuD
MRFPGFEEASENVKNMGRVIRTAGFMLALLSIVYTSVYAIEPINFSAQSERLQKALMQYYEIERDGGWTKINATKKFYLKGEKDPAIVQIKQRLKASGDYTSDEFSNLFNDDLVKAVMRIQKRFGFKENGVVDALLIKELNVPIEKRIDQLEINLDRLRKMPVVNEGVQLVANIPEYKLHVYENGKPAFDMDIVVGSENNRTVIFNDQMTHIVFSPYWNVPESIVRNEMLPAMRRDKSYLRRNNYELLGYENGLPKIRQRPGEGNSLGGVKFVFPNDHGIYFHDTPAKSLFGLPKRTFSHGCIRLAEPAKLAAFLLRNQGWTADKIEAAMKAGKEQTVKLPKAAAVSITYFTAWVDGDDLVHFRKDVYGYDKSAGPRVAKS